MKKRSHSVSFSREEYCFIQKKAFFFLPEIWSKYVLKGMYQFVFVLSCFADSSFNLEIYLKPVLSSFHVFLIILARVRHYHPEFDLVIILYWDNTTDFQS